MGKHYKVQGLNERLREAIFVSGKSVLTLAEEAGINYVSVYDHMNGTGVSTPYLLRYCKVLNVSADWLLGLKEEREL